MTRHPLFDQPVPYCNLRRFLVLEATRRPNLASECLGLALRELSAAWSHKHGYRPLLAESFSDPESHAGTVYKATNWTCAGDTKGPSFNGSAKYRSLIPCVKQVKQGHENDDDP